MISTTGPSQGWPISRLNALVRLAFTLLLFTASAATAATEWRRDSRVLLENFNNMYNPCVVETPGDYRYKMWLFGWAAGHSNPGVPGSDAIYHARSKDLQHWEVFCGDGEWDGAMTPERWSPVLTAGEAWYESWHTGDPSVVFADGRYYMAYSATSKPFGKVEGFPSEMVQCVMAATSDDGISWKKTDRPLLIASGDNPNPEASPGRLGDFHRPSLMRSDGAWRLWFDYRIGTQPACVGYAENRGDFLTVDDWRLQHDLREPLMTYWPNPEVVKIGDRYHSFSDPSGYPVGPGGSHWEGRQLREAVSNDGLHWEKLDHIPPDPDAEACHVPQALKTKIDGRDWLYLFYATQIGSKHNDGVYHYEYDRIRAMRRPIEE